MFPEYDEQIMDDPGSKTIFDVLSSTYNKGYNRCDHWWWSGSPSEFQSLAQKYNGSGVV